MSSASVPGANSPESRTWRGPHAAGRKAPVNDSWIAATAIARGIPVAAQDDDYDGMPGLSVIRL